MKKFNLVLCLSILCGFAASSCESESVGEGSPCTTAFDCGDRTVFSCADIKGTGKKVCVKKDMCSNKQLDASYGESDIDCGGVVCGATCKEGKSCKFLSDCSDGLVCDKDSKKCKPKVCQKHEDCVSGVCNIENGKKEGTCFVPDIVECDPKSLVINEVLTAPIKGEMFYDIKKGSSSHVEQTDCEYIEIVNISDNYMRLNGCQLHVNDTKTDSNSFLADLKGNVRKKGGVIVFQDGTCPELSTLLPSGVITSTWPAKKTLANSNPFEMYIKSIKGESAHITISEKLLDTKSGSGNLPSDLKTDQTAFIRHSSIPGVMNESQLMTPGYCSSGDVFESGCVLPCGNGVVDTDWEETDVDCGGKCGGCEIGKKCQHRDDCLSLNCNESKGVCEEYTCTSDIMCIIDFNNDKLICEGGQCVRGPECDDSEQNGDETDVDCGGPICKKCTKGQKCNNDADCDTFECTNHVCTGNVLRVALPNELVINEVMSQPDTSRTFELHTTGKQCDFVEIVNLKSEPLKLNGLSLYLLRNDTGHENDKVYAVPLDGVVAPNGAHIVFEKDCTIPSDLPEGVSNQYAPKSNFLTGSPATYSLYINVSEDATSLNPVQYPIAAKGYSSNRQTDKDPAAPMAAFTNASDYNNTPGYCANGGLFSNNCAVEDTCSNGKQDGKETDIDCGGPKCSKCQNDRHCEIDEDCISENCITEYGEEGLFCQAFFCVSDNHCKEHNLGNHCNDDGSCSTVATCDDEIKNGDETDVDCGGSCPNQCALGQACKNNEDCVSNECESLVCAGDAPVPATPADLIINEFMTGASTAKDYYLVDREGVDQQGKFMEIVNVSASRRVVDISGCVVKMTRTDVENKTIPDVVLKGALPFHQAYVAYEKPTLDLPQGVLFGKLQTTNMTQSSTFTAKIVCNDVEGESITIGKAPTGVSMVRQNDLDVKKELVSHKLATDVYNYTNEGKTEPLMASPGYCSNGRLLINNCQGDLLPSLKSSEPTE